MTEAQRLVQQLQDGISRATAAMYELRRIQGWLPDADDNGLLNELKQLLDTAEGDAADLEGYVDDWKDEDDDDE